MDAVYINTRIGPEVRKHLSMHQCTDVQMYRCTGIFVVPHADHMSNEAIGYKMLVTCCTHFYFTLYSITFCYTDINVLILNAPPPSSPFLGPPASICSGTCKYCNQKVLTPTFLC